jgi:hypothetical protein
MRTVEKIHSVGGKPGALGHRLEFLTTVSEETSWGR